MTEDLEWKCQAKPWINHDTPQDCDWPICGCDPYANKVIEALIESGQIISSTERRV